MITGQKHAVLYALALILAAAGGLGWWRWHEDAPKRTALQATEHFAQALFARDSQALLQAVALPIALQDRTAPEQAEFLLKALRDEVSAEGLAVLRRRGKFGPLATIFPAEAKQWAAQAGVQVEDCVAFRLDQSPGHCAEVVLLLSPNSNPCPSTSYKIVRCNNVN